MKNIYPWNLTCCVLVWYHTILSIFFYPTRYYLLHFIMRYYILVCWTGSGKCIQVVHTSHIPGQWTSVYNSGVHKYTWTVYINFTVYILVNKFYSFYAKSNKHLSGHNMKYFKCFKIRSRVDWLQQGKFDYQAELGFYNFWLETPFNGFISINIGTQFTVGVIPSPQRQWYVKQFM